MRNGWKTLTVGTILCAALAGCSDDTESPGADTGSQDASVDGSGADAGDTDDTRPRPDTSDGGSDTPQPDVDPDAALDGGDGASDTAPTDCDYDGIYDHEERTYGTDPCDADTDGDGLSDWQELQHGTDPLAADTDGDGVTDAEEVDLDLDPTKEKTYDDDIVDGDRWIVSACDDPSAEPVNYHSSSNIGNWQVALPPAFGNYTELAITGADITNRHAAAVFNDPANEVAAGLLSSTPDQAQQTVESILAARRQAVEQVGVIDQNTDGAGFDTHDYARAAIGRYRVMSNTPRSLAQMRHDLLLKMAPFGSADITNLPPAGGATYKNFRIFVSVVLRTYENGQRHALTSIAVAPSDSFASREKVRFRMNDLINTTNIAQPGDDHALNCVRKLAQPKHPVEFYWVLDHSGSMRDDNERMSSTASLFFNRLNNSNLDYRLGVTHMRRDQQGQLRPTAGWHTDMHTFTGEVDWIIGMDGYIEAGLEVAKRGIMFMKGLEGLTPPPEKKIREDAALITVWMTDDEEEYFQDHPIGTQVSQQVLGNYVDFFRRHTTSFAIIGDGDDCGVRDGYAYRQVVHATGGSTASVCSSDVSETINDIMYAASAEAGYKLTKTPVSSTLRVFLNGQWVPRSRQNGFDYFANTNTIAFFGDYRPQLAGGDAPDDRLVVNYETYELRRKR